MGDTLHAIFFNVFSWKDICIFFIKMLPNDPIDIESALAQLVANYGRGLYSSLIESFSTEAWKQF